MNETYTLTVPQMAEKLQISKQAAYALCKVPGFPSVRFGGSIRIPVKELDAWLSRQAQKST